MPLVFRVAAAADLEEAYRWYERQREGLGEDFLSAVQVAIETLGSNPEAHPVLHPDTRRILLRRFPYGSEDYAAPFLWTPPAAYVLCQHCHRHKLHKRFAKPDLWAAFLAHVRRGGYASDLKKPEVKREVERAQAAIRKGEKPSLASLRP